MPSGHDCRSAFRLLVLDVVRDEECDGSENMPNIHKKTEILSEFSLALRLFES